MCVSFVRLLHSLKPQKHYSVSKEKKTVIHELYFAHKHTPMNKLGSLIGLSLVSLEMQMASVKGDEHILVLDHILPSFLVSPRSCCTAAARSDQCVSVEQRQGEGEVAHRCLLF